MALGLGLIIRLLHTAQHCGVHCHFQLGAAHFVQNLAQLTLGGHCLFKFGRNAAGCQHLHQRVHLVRVRLLMHTIHKRQLFGAAQMGGAFVGQQHEFFDHALRNTALAAFHAHAHPGIVQDQLALFGFQLHGTARLALRHTLAIQLLHGCKLAGHFTIALCHTFLGSACQQSIDLFIHALHPAADQRFGKAIALHTPLRIQLHQAGKRQSVFAFVQAAHTVGKLFGQHGRHAAGIVHAGGTGKGFFVQAGARAHIIAYIRNVYAQLKAGFGGLDADGIVDILGFGRVDGKDGLASQIQPVRLLAFGNARGNGGGFVLHIVGEHRVYLMRKQNGPGALARAIGTAEAQSHRGLMVAVALAAMGEGRRHLIAHPGTARTAPAQRNKHLGAAVRRKEQPPAGQLDQRAHQPVFRLGDGGHLAFHAAGHTRALKQLYQNFIAGHSPLQAAARHKNIALAVIPLGKAEGFGQLDQHAGLALGLLLFFQGIQPGFFLHDPLASQFTQGSLHLFVVAQLPCELSHAAGMAFQLPQHLTFDGHILFPSVFLSIDFYYSCFLHKKQAARQKREPPALFAYFQS